MRDNPYKKLPPKDGSSAYTLFSVTSIEGINYKLQSFNEFEGHATGFSTNKACCATLLWSGQKDGQVPTNLFSENSVKSRVGVVLDPTKVDVPHADFLAFNSGGIVREEEIKGRDSKKNYHDIKSRYANRNKPGQLRFLRGGGDGSMAFFATNHAKWDAILKEAKPEASIETFAKNVWLKFHGTKKEKRKFDGSSRYGSQGKMPYNEALCFRQKGGENPIDGVFINLTNDDIDGLKQEEVDGVLEILEKNPRLKLYFYDSKSEDNIIRFCDNEKGKEILTQGVAYIKTKRFFQALTPLTERQYEKTKLSGAEAASVKKTTDLGQKAREFLREKNFSSIFGSLTFEQRKNLLLFSWGADSKDPTNKYDNFKNDFKTQNQGHGLTKLQLNQIFNDEARKEMIRFVAKESKYDVFLDKYNKKMTELGFPAFLGSDDFIIAKSAMIALIQQDFQEVNLQIQGLISCRYGDDNKVLVPSAEECKQVKIYYKKATLTEFQKILEGTQVLGAKYYDPYLGKIERFPDNKDDLTIRHLHILARNENYNTTGTMNESLYCDLLTSDQIAKLRCLVKATNIGAIGKVKSYGGYGGNGEIKEYQPAKDFIIIDQSGLQWQGDLRNSGGLFFYPDEGSKTGIENYSTWQDQTYKAMYGKDRGALSSNSVDITWNGVKGKMDLDKVAEAIKSEFLEALNTAKNQGDSLGEDKKINFRFLKAGFGCFCDGVKSIKGDLELARLKGINSALQSIVEIDEPNRLKFLGNIKSIELPYSKPEDAASTSGKDKEINDELEKIKEKLKTLGLEFDYSTKDALSEKVGFITAVTNCGDPHALFGNEGSYYSVDAMMSTNMVNPNILNPLINKSMMLVELKEDLKVVQEHSPAPAPAPASPPAPTSDPAPTSATASTPATAPTSDPAPTSVQPAIFGGLIGGALGAGAGFVGANLLITTTSLAMVIPPVGITVVTVGAVGVLGIVAGVHISKTIAQQIDNRDKQR